MPKPKPTRTPSMSDSLTIWEMRLDPKTGKLVPGTPIPRTPTPTHGVGRKIGDAVAGALEGISRNAMPGLWRASEEAERKRKEKK